MTQDIINKYSDFLRTVGDNLVPKHSTYHQIEQHLKNTEKY